MIDFSTLASSIEVSNLRFNLNEKALPLVLFNGSGLYFVIGGIENSNPLCWILSKNRTPYKFVLKSIGFPVASRLFGS